MYEIVTKPWKWVVKRKQTEFEWLRLTLSQTYPGYFVPPLSPEPPANDIQPDIIKKHISRLTLFLDGIFACPTLRGSAVLHTFLKDPDLNDMRSV